MQKRSRRPHGIHGVKLSISVSRDDLRAIRDRAKRMHRGNVSAVIHEMVDHLRRAEALDVLIAELGGGSATDAELSELRSEVAGVRQPRRRSKTG
jgi:hypothetical protein